MKLKDVPPGVPFTFDAHTTSIKTVYIALKFPGWKRVHSIELLAPGVEDAMVLSLSRPDCVSWTTTDADVTLVNPEDLK